eukprot:c34397_g1_i1 orf=332-1849(-)
MGRFMLIAACVMFCSMLLVSGRDLQVEGVYQLLDVDHSVWEDTGTVAYVEQDKGQRGAVEWMENVKVEKEGGMSLVFRVIHRDSAISPFRKPGLTRQQLFEERLVRDNLRVEALTRRSQISSDGIKNDNLKAWKPVASLDQTSAQLDFNGPIVSGLSQGSGEYFTRLGVGTPSQDIYMVLDTGSDISWIQCAPCTDCYNQTDQIFNPNRSSSFHTMPCTSPLCAKLDSHECDSSTNHCLYRVNYADDSFTTGDFSLETLSFNGTSLNSVAFGCGHDNKGLFAGAGGLLGLGGGSLSFPSQVGDQFNQKFSYCLVDRHTAGSSDIIFGNSAVPPGTIFMTMLKNPKLDTYYYVSLTGISVGGSRVSIPSSAFQLDGSGNGGVIVDSGTAVTRLVQTAYGPLRSAFRAAVPSLPFVGSFALFDTCYDLSNMKNVNVPTLVLHFDSAADVPLPSSNYFISVNTERTFCLALASTAGSFSIIGNIQQQGFRVVFDEQASRVGFAPNQCN